jgi:hypothetical protein
MDNKIKDWSELIDTDFPPIGPITEKTREQTYREASRFRGSVRISTGRFWTDEEFEEYRRTILNTPLP